jgi:conjugal transfer/type IV secretion protein DotA/TraY
MVGNINFYTIAGGFWTVLGPSLSVLFMYILPPFIAIMTFILTIGAMLAVYIPLIPYIIFTMAAIGWLIATIEAMVAGPIVALGILSPSSQHEILGSAFAGLMIMFNVFLRPSLMIFGLMAAMLLANVVVSMITTVFFEIAKDMTPGTSYISWIFIMLLYFSLLTVALNKVFSLIHILPENVMRWIGHQAPGYGEDSMVSQAKQSFEGGTSHVSGAGRDVERGGGFLGEAAGAKGKAARAKGDPAGKPPKT